MGLAKLTVPVADRPGQLGRLATALSDAGVNIIGLEVDHLSATEAVDVLLVALPDRLRPDVLTATLRSQHGFDATATDVGRRDLVDPVVRALNILGEAIAEPLDRRRLERALGDLVDSEGVWVLPLDPCRTGLSAAAADGIPVLGRTSEVRVVGTSDYTWVMAVPVPTVESHVAVLARRGVPFSSTELARVRSLLHAAARVGIDLTTPQAGTPRVEPFPCQLGDGSVLLVRSARPDDQLAILRMHARCSIETLRRRFLSPTPVLHSALIHHLIADSTGEAEALVVCAGNEIVAVGTIAFHGQARAELALLVQDAWQNRGVGAALATALLEVAESHGVRELTADVLADNVPMRRLIQRLDADAHWAVADYGSMSVTIAGTAGTST